LAIGPFVSYNPPSASPFLAYVKVREGAGHVLGKVSGSMWGELPVLDDSTDRKKSFGRDFRCGKCGSLLHLLEEHPGFFCVIMISMRGDDKGVSLLTCDEALIQSVMVR
jgi:hypothetical protein